MPRTARPVSKTGVYLIQINLYNKINITKNEDDLKTALHKLKITADKNLCSIYSYSFGKSSIELVVKETAYKRISFFIQSFLSQYSFYYNKKYSLTGPISKERFTSIPIDDTMLIPEIIAYIHKSSNDLKYTSYIEFFNDSETTIVNKKYVFSLIDYNIEKAQNDLLNLHNIDTQIPRKYLKINKKEIERIINNVSDVKASEIKTLSKTEQDNLFKILREEKQLKISEIQMLTGLSKNIITRYKKYENKKNDKEEIWLL